MQNQKGNIVLIIAGIIAVAILASGVGYFVAKKPIPFFSKKIIIGIKIDPPYQSLGNLSPDKQKEQSIVIAESIDKVLNDLDENKYSYSGVKKFTIIPGFAITVSEDGYQYLLKHPLVTNIEEDKPMKAF